MLVACANTTPPVMRTGAPLDAPKAHLKTFNYTGKEQIFRVPGGVASITIKATGASGSASYGKYEGTSGNGGLVIATVAVVPKEKLRIFVGGQNGYNGGGSAPSSHSGINGGGASDVRQGNDNLSDRFIVAGGCGAGGIIPYSYVGTAEMVAPAVAM